MKKINFSEANTISQLNNYCRLYNKSVKISKQKFSGQFKVNVIRGFDYPVK